MNAKKIMGAVLVALLAAALFAGAGAAALADGDTVFVYQNVENLNGTWANGANTITATAIDATHGYFAGDNIVEGTYKQGDLEITVKYPTASVAGVAVNGSTTYSIIGGTLYKNAEWANFTVTSAAKTGLWDVFVTYPDGTAMKGSVALAKEITAGTVIIDSTNAGAGTLKIAINQSVLENLSSGTYKIQGILYPSDAAGQLLPSTPDKYLVGKDVFTFNIAGSEDATISANVESVTEQEIITVTVTGMPGDQFTINGGSNFEISSNGTVQTNPAVIKFDANTKFVMPNDGVAVIYMKAVSDGNGKITVTIGGKEKSVSVKVNAGEITAKTDKESYYIGDDVTISGTSTAGNKLFVYIQGTNVNFQNISGVEITTENGKWEEELTADELMVKKSNTANSVGPQTLDAGTYTLYITTTDPAKIEKMEVGKLGTYTTVALVLKQPFVSITDAPAVAVKETEYKVTGTAEATSNLAVYVFGTNFYAATNGYTNVTGDILSANTVDFEGNEFTIKFTVSDDMAAGQYFMVIQHPMYDEDFNIAANNTGDILLNNTGDAVAGDKILFNVYKRQTANAAQALCDALETEDIDDMYVKLSFVVAAPTSTINPIPSEITQGSKLTISGSTNLGEGKVVTVEMLSTAFAAVPKDTVGSAAFASVITKTDADGNWEVTIDTSDLNVDEYTVSVAVANLDSTTAKINVIEGAPTEQPTENPTEQPTQTEQPTEAPSTPGFGALAALAGLGAVAVLLLRRE